MKTANIFLAFAIVTLTIVSCKKEKEEDPAPTTPSSPTSNYYIFDGVTYSYGAHMGCGQVNDQFNFFSSDPNSDNEIRLFFKIDPADNRPKAGTYSVVAHAWGITDSTTCSVKVHKDTTDYISTAAGGIITVGKSGTQTTYNFTALPLSASKTVTGTFTY